MHTLLRTCLIGLLAATSVAADRPQADIATNHGTIRVALYIDEAPLTVANFLALAAGTPSPAAGAGTPPISAPFYDGLTFHRVIADFMLQGGCPQGDGSGGPGFAFKDEINATSLGLGDEKAMQGDGLHPQCNYMVPQFYQHEIAPRFEKMGLSAAATPQDRQQALVKILPELQQLSLKQFYEDIGYHYDDALPPSRRPVKGSLCMANSGPGTNGSQFFINLVDTPHLTGKHTVFGEVVSGMDVVNAISAVPVDPESAKPLTPVTITSIRAVAP